MNDWTLKTRFAASGAAIAVCLAALAGGAFYAMNHFRTQLDRTVKENLEADKEATQIAEVRHHLREQHIAFKDHLIHGDDPARASRYVATRKANEKEALEHFDAARRIHDVEGGSTGAIEALAAEHKALSALYDAAVAKLDPRRWEPSVQAADALVGDKDRALDAKLGKMLEAASAAIESTAAYQKDEAATIAQRMSIFLGIVSGVVLLGVAGLFALLARYVVGRLGGDPAMALAAAHRVACGDLTGEIRVSPGDTTSLLAAMARMQESLKAMVAELNRNAGEISGTAQSLASTSSQIAGSTAHQSEAASSMAASVEEMTVSIDQLNQHSTDALKVSRQAGELSAKGNEAVQGTVGEMGHIASSAHELTGIISTLGGHSQQISRIVQVIGEIASQTNLLALNAAIEAARAGEQGRGFSVVADEVRKLAERTTASTEEISQMIGAIQKGTGDAVAYMDRWCNQVNVGADKARDAGEIMTQVNGDAARATEAVTEIANALSEQSSASTLIAQNVEKIAQMSEENNAAVGAMADSAQALGRLAESMQALVAKFRLRDAHAYGAD